jgi:Putative prokaryotic signal transducing protein
VSDDLITIRTLTDAAVAEMYRDILEGEGIVAMIPGAQHRSMLGMVGAYVDIPLKVLAADAERAAEIIDAIESGVPEADWAKEAEAEAEAIDEDEDAGNDDAGDDDEGDKFPARRKLKRIAFFIAFAIPGGAHYYLRRWWLGAIFAGGEVLGGILLASLGEMPLAMIWVPGLVLGDALGAVSRVAEANGEPAPPLRWLSRSLAVVVALVVAAVFVVTEQAPASVVGPSGRTVCQRLRSCHQQPYARCELGIVRNLRRAEIKSEWLKTCGRCLKRQPCGRIWKKCSYDCRRANVSLIHGAPSTPLFPPRAD